MKSNIVKGYFFMLVSVIANACGPPAFLKISNPLLSNQLIVAFFLLSAGISMLFIYPVERRSRKEKSGEFKISFAIVLRVGLLCLIFPISFLLYIYVMEISSVTEATFIIKSNPLFVVFIAAIILKERIKNWPYAIIAALICLYGASVVQSNYVNMQAYFNEFTVIGLFTAFLLALHRVLIKYLNAIDKISNSLIVSLSSIIGAIVIIVIEIIKGTSFYVPTTYEIGIILFLGIVTVAIAVYFNIKAFNYGSVGSLTQVEYLGPIFTAIIAYLWNDEIGFNYFDLAIGFVLISAGIYFVKKQVISD